MMMKFFFIYKYVFSFRISFAATSLYTNVAVSISILFVNSAAAKVNLEKRRTNLEKI